MLNHVTIMGRITRDPELRRTTSGVAVVTFTLACDRDYQSKDTQERETDFINCTAWRSTAEYISKYFPKGRMAIVTGRLQVRKYTDKDGNNRTATDVVVDNIYYGDYSRPQSMQGAFENSGSTGGYQSGSQNSGYQSSGSYGGYSQPAAQTGGYQSGAKSSYGNSDFSILEDDDNTLPF